MHNCMLYVHCSIITTNLTISSSYSNIIIFAYKPVESKLCVVVVSFDDLLGCACTLFLFTESITITNVHSLIHPPYVRRCYIMYVCMYMYSRFHLSSNKVVARL